VGFLGQDWLRPWTPAVGNGVHGLFTGSAALEMEKRTRHTYLGTGRSHASDSSRRGDAVGTHIAAPRRRPERMLSQRARENRAPTERGRMGSRGSGPVNSKTDSALSRSAYSPYPRYRPMAGALGEYNGIFMVNQMGCCAARRSQLPPGVPGRATATFSLPRRAGSSVGCSSPILRSERRCYAFRTKE